jgi:hypothetical protein
MEVFLQRKGREELNEMIIKVCSRVFGLEYQNKYFKERDYVGDSWIANLYCIYVNDYITFDRFYQGEVCVSICDNIDFLDDKLNEAAEHYCRERVQGLYDTFREFTRYGEGMSLEKIGLKLEKLIAEVMPAE